MFENKVGQHPKTSYEDMINHDLLEVSWLITYETRKCIIFVNYQETNSACCLRDMQQQPKCIIYQQFIIDFNLIIP